MKIVLKMHLFLLVSCRKKILVFSAMVPLGKTNRIFFLFQGDPVRDLVLRYMGEQEALRRSVLTVDSVTQDADGLKKLMVLFLCMFPPSPCHPVFDSVLMIECYNFKNAAHSI